MKITNISQSLFYTYTSNETQISVTHCLSSESNHTPLIFMFSSIFPIYENLNRIKKSTTSKTAHMQCHLAVNGQLLLIFYFAPKNFIFVDLISMGALFYYS